MNASKNIVVFLFCIVFLSLRSQTSEQARSFVNRTHIAIAKAEKEMYKLGKNEFDAEVKIAMKFQTIALKMYQDGKMEKAVGYSFKAREISLQALNTLSKPSVEFLSVNDDEKTFCKPDNYKELYTNDVDKVIGKKIDELNLLDAVKFREIELNIK